MKRKTINMNMLRKIYVVFLSILVGLVSCQKNDEKKAELPSLETLDVIEIEKNTAKSGGNITSDGGSTVTSRGVFWGLTENPGIETYEGLTVDGIGSGIYQSNLTNLIPNTTYFVRAYATNAKGTGYGKQQQFVTSAGNLSTISTNLISEITTITATGGGNISDEGSTDVMQKGVCWSENPNPTIIDFITNDGNGPGEFTSLIKGLKPGTKYYLRAYSTNAAGTAYGNQINFNTIVGLPFIITTKNVTEIDTISALSGGFLVKNEDVTIIRKGVCWDFFPNPTINDYLTNDGSEEGSFESRITGLSPALNYYIRAYAESNEGILYGEQKFFKTDIGRPPTIITIDISDITGTSGKGGGNVINEGSTPVEIRGVCWSVSAEPTINNASSESGTGIGHFIVEINGLDPTTTYYARAYAVNKAGIVYGNQVEFTTTVMPPLVFTKPITSITSTTAMSGGNITSQTSTNITQRGVCWSTLQNPSISDFKTIDGNGLGEYFSEITGLAQATTYFVRAYAINQGNVLYGNQIQFTSAGMFMVGDGCIAGWDNNNGLFLSGANGVYTIDATLFGAGKYIKFLTTPGQWAPMYGTDASGTSIGGALVYRPSESDPDPASIPVPDEFGMYTITVNINEMVYTIEPVDKD